MFTGIVQAMGKIVRLQPLEIEAGRLDLSDVAVGDSICVQGVCLTVTALKGKGGPDLPQPPDVVFDQPAQLPDHATPGVVMAPPAGSPGGLVCGRRRAPEIVAHL